jgi:hypothetical protein
MYIFKVKRKVENVTLGPDRCNGSSGVRVRKNIHSVFEIVMINVLRTIER